MAVGKTTRRLVFDRDRGQCVFCGTIHNLTIDHIHPLSKGGNGNIENLQTLCRKCNHAKGNHLNYDPKNPPKQKQRKKMTGTAHVLGFNEVPVISEGYISNRRVIIEGPKVLGKIDIPAVSVNKKIDRRRKRDPKKQVAKQVIKNLADTPKLTGGEFQKKLQKRYPYAYSLIPVYLWIWIFDNLIAKEL